MDIRSILAMMKTGPVGALNSAAAAPPSELIPAPMSVPPGFLEALAMAMNGGRDNGQRAFYNATRDGIWSSETTPADTKKYDDHGREMLGGLFQDLNTRRSLQGYDAQAIEDAILGSIRSGGK